MRRLIELCLLVIILAGCSSEQKVSSDELLKPRETDTLFAQKWVNIYGDKIDSVRDYNIALMLRIMNQQDARIKELEDTAIEVSGKIDNIKGTWENIRKDCGEMGDNCLLKSKCSRHALDEAIQWETINPDRSAELQP